MFSFLFDFIFPPQCWICQKKLDFEKPLYCCRSCYRNLPWIKDKYCQLCGRGLLGEKNFYNQCQICLNSRRYFSHGYSAFFFAPPLKNLLIQMKYHSHWGIHQSLAFLLFKALVQYADIPFPPLMTYVPLHFSGYRKRGFNQSFLIAKSLSQYFDTKLCHVLKRTKQRGSQTQLNFEDRVKNVSGCFEIKKGHRLHEKSIFLIDDVLTSGSTTNECARILSDFGYEKIVVLSLMSIPDENFKGKKIKINRA